MIHVFKAGGDWSTADGTTYTIKSIKEDNKSKYLADGWSLSLEEVKAEVENAGVDGGDYERQLRDKIKALGGKAGGRASVETLELKLAELEAKSEIGIE